MVKVNDWQTPKGWECPRCGRVNSPSMSQCTCKPAEYLGPWSPYTYPAPSPWWGRLTSTTTSNSDEGDGTGTWVVYSVDGVIGGGA